MHTESRTVDRATTIARIIFSTKVHQISPAFKSLGAWGVLLNANVLLFANLQYIYIYVLDKIL